MRACILPCCPMFLALFIVTVIGMFHGKAHGIVGKGYEKWGRWGRAFSKTLTSVLLPWVSCAPGYLMRVDRWTIEILYPCPWLPSMAGKAGNPFGCGVFQRAMVVLGCPWQVAWAYWDQAASGRYEHCWGYYGRTRPWFHLQTVLRLSPDRSESDSLPYFPVA